jgi:hypothetical protein
MTSAGTAKPSAAAVVFGLVSRAKRRARKDAPLSKH